LSDRADVLVIGGGIVGVCSAHYLAARGKSVVLLERDDIASGSSAGNAGFVCPSHSIPMAQPGVVAKGLKWMFDPDSPFYIKPRFSPALFSWLWKFRAACTEERVRRVMTVLRDLHCESVERFDEISRIPGVAFGWTRRGLLSLFRTDHAYEEGLKEGALLQEIGVPSRALSAAEIAERVPRAKPGLAGGIHFPGDAHLDPLAFVRGLASYVGSRGVDVRTGTDVTGFGMTGRKITSVRTTKGEFAADQIVLAAGSWSPSIARELRLKIPVQPAKGYSITMPRPEGAPTVPLLLIEAKVGVTPIGDRLRLAGTLELAGLDLTINDRRVEAIRRGAATFLDGLEAAATGEVWRGLRPCTPDGLPIVGRSAAFDNLILATGHAMIGVSLGPVTGSLVAKIASGESTDIDLTVLKPERF
jgi:D-amino-acid dehydrogenase